MNCGWGRVKDTPPVHVKDKNPFSSFFVPVLSTKNMYLFISFF